MKHFTIKAILFTLTVLISSSCMDQTKDSQSENMSAINALLNSREYERAISKLKNEIRNRPTAREIRIKLAHAYAGAGGFQAVDFAALLKDIEGTKLGEKAGDFIYLAQRALKSVPNLSDKQKQRLSQAIDLYNQLEMNPHNTTKENNFKWGTLHVFRLLVTMKESVNFVDDIVKDRTKFTEDEIQKFFIEKADLVVKDFFQSYLLFKNSYDKLRNIASKFEDILKNTLKDKGLQLKIESKALTYKKFIKDIIEQNKEIASAAFANISKEIDLLNIEGSVKQIFKGLKDNKQDVKARLEKLEMFARLIIENLILKHTSQHGDIKDIFNQQLVDQTESAIELALKEKSFQPIKDFLNSKESNINYVVEAWKTLQEGYDNPLVAQIVEPEVRTILNYLDAEEAKRLKNNASNTAENVEIIADEALENIEDITKSKTQEVIDQAREDKEELEDDLQPKYEQLQEVLHEEDQELDDNAQDIIDKTKDFILGE